MLVHASVRERLLAQLLELPRGPARAHSGRQARLGAVRLRLQGRDAGQSGAVGGVGGVAALLLRACGKFRLRGEGVVVLQEVVALPLRLSSLAWWKVENTHINTNTHTKILQVVHDLS